MKMMDKKEDLKYNVDTCNNDFMEHLDFTKDEPQSEVNSVTSQASRCANEELQLKHMVQISQRRKYRNYSNLTRPLINAHRPFLAKIVIYFHLILFACPKFLVIYFPLIINAQPNLQQKVQEKLKTTTQSLFSVSIVIFLQSTK